MKKTIKKILKEEISNGYTRFELLLLQWIYKEHKGDLFDFSFTNYKPLFRKIKSNFGLSNKEMIKIITLYKDNYTTGGFHMRDDVIRTPLKKYDLGFVYDYNSYQTNSYVVWGVDEDEAFEFANASEDTGEFVESFIEGEIYNSGNRGDHFDTTFEEINETIKKELNLLKEERNKKLTDKFLIVTFKILDKWMQGEGHDIDEVETDASVYEQIIKVVKVSLGIVGQEDIDFIVASFVLNYMTAGDWDLLKEIGVKEPQIKKWELSKTYGIRAYVTDIVRNVEGYLPSEMMYAEWDGGYDWDRYDMDIQDYFDEELDITEV